MKDIVKDNSEEPMQGGDWMQDGWKQGATPNSPDGHEHHSIRIARIRKKLEAKRMRAEMTAMSKFIQSATAANIKD